MGTNAPDKPGKSIWFKLRIGILLVLLLGVGGVLGYDYLLAKPNYKASHEKLDTMFREARGMIKVESGRPTYTPADVSDAIGKKPSETRMENDDLTKIETYEWYRGTPAEIAWDDEGIGFRPFPKYFFEVVYSKNDKSGEYELKEVSGQNARAQEQLARVEFDDNSGVELARPSAPGAPPGAGQGKARQFTPEQMIDRAFSSDTDGDEKLSKDEVDGRLADSFDRIDSDKDGFITKDELKTALENMGGGGRGSKGGKEGRPKKDSGDKKGDEKEVGKTENQDDKKSEEVKPTEDKEKVVAKKKEDEKGDKKEDK